MSGGSGQGEVEAVGEQRSDHQQGLTLRSEEPLTEAAKIPRKSVYDTAHYRRSPESMILKLKELRYSENTIRIYRACLKK
ncbi:MAG: hypothetical protein H7X99_03965 [Saprospiraceae bacterium]|nr:hypothetical protein [Saprospiraceae bacterium]